MTARLNPLLAIAAAVLLAVPAVFGTSALEAQEQVGDYRVLIPDFMAEDGNDRGFGERTANELRDRVKNIPGYATVERREIQDAVRKYSLKMEEIDCIKAMQLGTQELEARVAFCVTYASEGDDRAIKSIEVWDLWDRQSFSMPTFTVARNQQRDAAQQIFEGFDAFVRQLQHTRFCMDYASSQSWDDALRNCEQALELNPEAMVTLKLKADILRELGRHEEALAAIDKVIEADPIDDGALQLGGYLATQLGQTDKGRDYYRRYLELNPGDVGVRRTIAYDMNEAGDPEGAMLFIEEGLAVEEDTELLLSYGIYAFQAADLQSRAAQAENSAAGVSPPVAELYRKAVGAFEKVFEAQGAEMDVRYLRNSINAYLQLQDNESAIRASERFLAVHNQDTELLSRLATALERSGRVDDALVALQRIEAIDPSYANLYRRQGMLMVNAGRMNDALPLLQKAVQNGDNADEVARILFAEAANKHMQPPENWAAAIGLLETAKQFPVSQEQMQEFNFFHGYALYQRAVSLQPANDAPPTVAIARQTMPLFQEAKRLVEASRPWAQRTNRVGNVDQISNAADQYVEIMGLTIQRGGGH
jgi:tetratricopeptide (TPR) repeat protein